MQLVSGWLVDRFNVNWVIAGGFFLWSAATAATGFVHLFAMLFILRLLLGIGESVAFPSYSKIIALNFSEEHRGFANSVITTGYVLGPGFGMLCGGMLMARFGWRPFFIVLGVASMLWLLPWLKFMPKNRPAPATADSIGAPSLLEFVQLRSAWGTCLGLFFGNYVNYFLITWLPYYLVRERHFSMNKMARIGGVAYLSGACIAMLSGWLSDRWIASGATPTLSAQNICRRRPRSLRHFHRPRRRQQSGLLHRRAHLGRRLLWCGFFQRVRHHANARRCPSCRALDRLPECLWQSRWSRRPRRHRLRPSAHRPVLLGLRHPHRRFSRRHGLLGFSSRPHPPRNLAQKPPAAGIPDPLPLAALERNPLDG